MKSGNKFKLGFYVLLILALVIYLKFRDKNYYTIPTFVSEEIVFAVIEIPAGTNKKYEYNAEENKFELDQINNQDRVINYLPYPFNYGFIPSTYMDPVNGGDGDALDILILSESREMKTVMKVFPIALIELIDNNEIDTKIVAVPFDDSNIIDAYSLSDLREKYPTIINTIENWFLNYKGNNQIQIKSWKEKEYALDEIKKWERKY